MIAVETILQQRMIRKTVLRNSSNQRPAWCSRILDCVEVVIGDNTQIRPGLQLATADHPRIQQESASGAEFGGPLQIGRNLWIGAGALILPRVTFGDDAAIGAGSLVTKDVPNGTTVMRNSARTKT